MRITWPGALHEWFGVRYRESCSAEYGIADKTSDNSSELSVQSIRLQEFVDSLNAVVKSSRSRSWLLLCLVAKSRAAPRAKIPAGFHNLAAFWAVTLEITSTVWTAHKWVFNPAIAVITGETTVGCMFFMREQLRYPQANEQQGQNPKKHSARMPEAAPSPVTVHLSATIFWILPISVMVIIAIHWAEPTALACPIIRTKSMPSTVAMPGPPTTPAHGQNSAKQ